MWDEPMLRQQLKGLSFSPSGRACGVRPQAFPLPFVLEIERLDCLDGLKRVWGAQRHLDDGLRSGPGDLSGQPVDSETGRAEGMCNAASPGVSRGARSLENMSCVSPTTTKLPQTTPIPVLNLLISK